MNKQLRGVGNSGKVVFLSLIMMLFVHSVSSQFYETGQDPFSTSWKQIKTKNYKLIFPSEFEKPARLFAAAMDTFYPVSSKFLIKKPKPISILLHTQSSLSNGLVVYAPKRMELYTIPPQDNYPQDWLDQLALHETRHVVQLGALNQGITKVGSILLGQQAVGGISGMVPRWFLEGDAVYSETIFSSAGRGRSAAFLMPYRTLTVDNKKFSYEKALLGSYRDFVPDVYQMGYPIVKMMRDSFDNEIFGRSLAFTARNPYLIFPFGHALTHTSGLNNRHSYEFTYSNLKKQWDEHTSYDTYRHWPVKETRTFTNYNLPTALNDSMLLVQKYSLAETRRYSVIDKSGKEKKLLAVGSNSGEKISVYKNRIIWSENKTDLRWTNRTYSEVMVFDMETKKLKRLTKRTWYFSPVFSPNGSRIATIEETPTYESYLVILDAASGDLISRTKAPGDNHLQTPQWPLGSDVYCMAVGKNGKSIVKLSGNGIWETVVPVSYKNISNYCVVNNNIVFAGENNGINDLFLYDPAAATYRQITRSRFGAFEPSIDTINGVLHFAEYTPKGYRPAFLPWNPDSLTPVPGYTSNAILPDTHPLSGFNIQNIQKDSVQYPAKKFSRLSHLINVHSWIPAYYNYSVSDISNPNVYPGFILLSQDVLGTLISTFGYSFEDGYSHLHATLNYKALYPVISWSIDAGGPAQRIGGSTSIPLKYSNNLQSVVNISLPLNFSRGNKAAGITPYAEWEYDRDAYYLKSDKQYHQALNFINWGLNAYWYTRMASRDIFPRFGFSTYFRTRTSPFENDIFNNIMAASFRQYLPGIAKNHSFQLRYAHQYQSPLNYLYSSLISFPAGYTAGRSEELNLVNVNYAMPLFYPDIHGGPLFYLKRIRTTLFYDWASNKYRNTNRIITNDILRSVGADIIADIHFMRLMFPFQVGARVFYHPEEKYLSAQAIFSVSLVY